MDDDAELEAIRQRLRNELLGQQGPAAAPPPPAAPVDVTDAAFADFVRAHRLVLIDVWAAWCGPCRILSPIVDQVAREMSGKLTVGKVDADENPAVMQAFGIQSIPTLLLFADGRLVDRVTGALPKPQLMAWVQRHLTRGSGAVGPRR